VLGTRGHRIRAQSMIGVLAATLSALPKNAGKAGQIYIAGRWWRWFVRPVRSSGSFVRAPDRDVQKEKVSRFALRIGRTKDGLGEAHPHPGHRSR
jgi:hypothetical protein